MARFCRSPFPELFAGCSLAVWTDAIVLVCIFYAITDFERLDELATINTRPKTTSVMPYILVYAAVARFMPPQRLFTEPVILQAMSFTK